MTRAEQLTWRQAGGSYYAEKDGRIVALLYWYGPEAHYLHGGPDAAEPPRPGWFVVMVDEPGDHRAIDAPEPHHGEELGQLGDPSRAALDAATAVVAHCLDRAKQSS